MMRVVVEVSCGAEPQRLIVQSRSIQGALSIVEEHYIEGGEARIIFPIEPEPFFVRNPDAAIGLVEIEEMAELPGSSMQDRDEARHNDLESSILNAAAASLLTGGMVAASENAAQPVEDEQEVVKDATSEFSNRDSGTSEHWKGGLRA